MYTADWSTMIFRSWLTTPQSSSAVLLIMKKHIIHARSATRRMLISNARRKAAGGRYTCTARKRHTILYRNNPTSLNAGTIGLALGVMVTSTWVMSWSLRICLGSKWIAKSDKSKAWASSWQWKTRWRSGFTASTSNSSVLVGKTQKSWDVEVSHMSSAQPTSQWATAVALTKLMGRIWYFASAVLNGFIISAWTTSGRRIAISASTARLSTSSSVRLWRRWRVVVVSTTSPAFKHLWKWV